MCNEPWMEKQKLNVIREYKTRNSAFRSLYANLNFCAANAKEAICLQNQRELRKFKWWINPEKIWLLPFKTESNNLKIPNKPRNILELKKSKNYSGEVRDFTDDTASFGAEADEDGVKRRSCGRTARDAEGYISTSTKFEESLDGEPLHSW